MMSEVDADGTFAADFESVFGPPESRQVIAEEQLAELKSIGYDPLEILRMKKTKGCGSRLATLTMVFKLAQSAQKRWRKLNGYERIGEVVAGKIIKDGVLQAA